MCTTISPAVTFCLCKSQHTSDGELGRLWSAGPPDTGRAKHFADEPRGLQPVLERNEVKTTSHPVTACRSDKAAARQAWAIGRLGEKNKKNAKNSLTDWWMSQNNPQSRVLSRVKGYFYACITVFEKATNTYICRCLK
ncbi:TPA: hypothetical protein ACHTCR_005690 [Pseudomonas putida]|jgi:hypothetical protein|uniref:hypothetical protein n=1 Tax=Pseudomonas TaxID=286 RepID=UPI00114D3C45|nr:MULTISPECIES: hypothetical protein [Pseudomonas]MBP0710485.1 hypothetical protein [Pseudomonas sp. T34]MCE1002980.1 hypothetical protein [Pseudomonas sp. NMI1173_11]MCK2189931.1 hypothetical protein [Pseudomonas sp. MB04B]MDD2087399.1 hypothetical protein [Pseudomonas putida]MDD2097697.1 hypothetical protein [Pseudomonas putida]